MGPYCRFCNNRCFVLCPDHANQKIKEAYTDSKGGIKLMATCKEGQAFEKTKTGWCFSDTKKQSK